ncbi:MAG: hypothetical protein II368_02770, partial [Clostridia bacterium]|nr:hypothetical protein [Clostridia bacterium]
MEEIEKKCRKLGKCSVNALTKKCSKCGRELPLSRFSKCTSLKDGLQKKCKECASLYNKERYKA